MADDSNVLIWMNGQLIPEAEATIHVKTHAMHYGSSVFEGIRAYETPTGTAIFRLGDHIDRLFYSAKAYRMTMRHSHAEFMQACRDVVRENDLSSAYIRPLVWIGNIGIGLNAPEGSPTGAAIMAQPWGPYLGKNALEDGIRVCVTSWTRLAPNTIPAGVKAGGNYLSSQLIAGEASRHGYDEGIGLACNGLLSEGAGENLFFVKQGKLYTPPASASLLAGITRDTVFCFAAELGFDVVEQDLPREFMYGADEMFMTGTAAEITPVISVDDIGIGDGKRGPVTREIQERFFGLFSGETEDAHGWLDYV
jgi:branched-chain amino acid aminotransferase